MFQEHTHTHNKQFNFHPAIQKVEMVEPKQVLMEEKWQLQQQQLQYELSKYFHLEQRIIIRFNFF